MENKKAKTLEGIKDNVIAELEHQDEVLATNQEALKVVAYRHSCYIIVKLASNWFQLGSPLLPRVLKIKFLLHNISQL